MTFLDGRIYQRAQDREAQNFAEWEGRWLSKLGADCDSTTLRQAFDDAHAMGEQSGEKTAHDELKHMDEL